MTELDATDKKILNVLSKEAKLSFREVAKQAGISPATVMNRVRLLEQEGIIKRYSASINYEKAGYDVGVVIHVRVSKGRLMDVEKKIASDPHVVSLYDITGHFDAIVVAYFKNRRALDNFLKKIQTFDFVERTETVLILNTIKEGNAEIG